MPVIRKKLGNNNINNNSKQRSITDFTNTDYRRYSQYVISNRCCPSILDGMRTGARKILYSAFVGGLKDEKEHKVLNLVGDVFNKTLFAHGDASLIGTIIAMGAKFLDNIPALEIVGQGGTLRDKSCASARYLSCKLNKFADIYKTDNDLLEYVFDEGEYLEPIHFLPIIPTVLTARSEGLAPGYKFQSFSYNPIDIIDACIEALKKGKITTIIHPYVNGIDPAKFIYDEELKRWVNVGSYEIDEKHDVLKITDLPFDIGYEKFEKKLNTLIDKDYIKEWKNFSQDNKLDYRIAFNKSKLSREMQPDRKEKTIKQFFLQSLVPEDLLYVLDENNHIKHFKTKEDLILYFVKLRLNKYNDRKSKLVSVMENKLQDNENTIKFITLVIDKKIVINNRKKSDIKTDLAKYQLPETLINIPLSRLTADDIKDLNKKNDDIKKELEYIKNTTIETMYLNDLKELKKSLKDEFVVCGNLNNGALF